MSPTCRAPAPHRRPRRRHASPRDRARSRCRLRRRALRRAHARARVGGATIGARIVAGHRSHLHLVLAQQQVRVRSAITSEAAPVMHPAYAAMEARAQLVPFCYAPGALGPHDVELEVTHCGLCYSDIHLIDDDWKKSPYPLVPGTRWSGGCCAAGPRSRTSRSASAWASAGSTARACSASCACRSREPVPGADRDVRRSSRRARGADDRRRALRAADARRAAPAPRRAPLLCGGVTVYAPMRRFGMTGESRVGVIGIGGLGHMAIAFGARWAPRSPRSRRSPDKRDEALRMGAHRCVGSTEVREIKKLGGAARPLLSTVHARLDWVTLPPGAPAQRRARACSAAAPGLLRISQHALLGQRAITTGEIGSRAAIAEVLALAARHAIAPEIEVAPMQESQRRSIACARTRSATAPSWKIASDRGASSGRGTPRAPRTAAASFLRCTLPVCVRGIGSAPNSTTFGR